MRRLSALGVGLVLGLAAPAVGHAQTPDPDSPAGVEYALPLDQAREDARGDSPKRKQGSGGNPSDSTAAAPLFGAGISKQGGGSKGGTSGTGSPSRSGQDQLADRGSASGGAGRESTDEDAGTPDERAARTATRAGVEDGGSSFAPALLGLVAAVLLIGGGIGLALRRIDGRPEA